MARPSSPALSVVSSWRQLAPGATYTRYDHRGQILGRYAYQGIDKGGDLLWVNGSREQSRMDARSFDSYYHVPG